MDSTRIDKIINTLHDASLLTPLQLNAMRFSGKHTLITERRLRKVADKVGKS